MLSDRELEQNTAQLQAYRTRSEQYQEAQSDILEKYDLLLEDYKRLKSDFEEERDTRERYKQLAKGQDRSPFVLVLIDGDQYIFHDHLITNGGDGGARAAQLLHYAVSDSLRSQGLDQCRIMVRAYADVCGLSKALNKKKLLGAEKRAMAPFIAGFNKTEDLFDFVDAGELKENIDSKIRAVFRQFVENPQCKHIFFAACHNNGHVQELITHSGKRNQITLVRHQRTLHDEWEKLSLRHEDLSSVFSTVRLMNGDVASHLKKYTSATPPASVRSSTPTVGRGNVCSFFQKSFCKYGKNCKYQHVKKTSNGHSPSAFSLADGRSWRKGDSSNEQGSPFETSPKKTIGEYVAQHLPADGTSDPDFANLLPGEEDIPENQLPINKNGQRLDPHLTEPSAEDRAHFNARTSRRKLCNNHHLNGSCSKGPACPYDHSAITEGMRICHKRVTLGTPCPRGGACRRQNCVYGHICQKNDCRHRGGRAYCRLPMAAHTADYNVAEYVQGNNTPTKEEFSEHEMSSEEEGASEDLILMKEEADVPAPPLDLTNEKDGDQFLAEIPVVDQQDGTGNDSDVASWWQQ